MPADVSPPDADAHLRTGDLLANLRGRAVRGGAVTLGAQGARFVIQLGGLAVLARLLTPEDFGVVAMVTALTGFVALFSELGLSAATVQDDDLTDAQVSTLFWVNLGVGAALAVSLAALAPLVARLYGDERLTAVTIVFAATFAIGGAGVQHRALLLRSMRFGALAAIRVTSLVLGTAASIVAALLGAGYWALVLGPLVMTVVGVGMVWVLSAWRPGTPRRGTGVRRLLRYGGNLVGFTGVNYFARRADDILLGVTWGAAPLAVYNTAYRILLLPVSQINAPLTNVALPTLSRLKNDPERYRRYYREAMGLLAFVGMPVIAFCFAAAEDLIAVVLGPQWGGAVPVFRALGPAAFVGTVNVAAGWVFLSLGHVDRQLRWAMFTTPFVVMGFVLGLPWGALGVAVGCSVVLTATWFGGVLYGLRGTFLRLADLFGRIWQPAIAALVAAVVTYATAHSLPESLPPLPRLLIEGLTYGFAWLGAWAVSPAGRARFRASVLMIRSAVGSSCIEESTQ